jgi:L,D-peptidoglycan transpeptidase YkuD (ErfK/YbiS/YcfS/YnhG family)
VLSDFGGRSLLRPYVARGGRSLLLTVVLLLIIASARPVPARAAVTRARLKVPTTAEQLIVVSSATRTPRGKIATLRAFQRANETSAWRQVFGPWQAEIGYGGLIAAGARREGDGATPIGVFKVGSLLYGNERNPGRLHDHYHHLVCGDWWDEDQNSSLYNRFVHVRCGTKPAFGGDSEALWTETIAYPYFAVIDFNIDPTIRGAKAPGSGIFLHSWVGGPTAGCVAIHRAQLLRVLRWLKPSAHPSVEIALDREEARLNG